MRYEIIGKTVPAVEFTLNRGESIYSQEVEWLGKQMELIWKQMLEGE